MTIRTPPCLWCAWAQHWRRFKLRLLGGEEAVANHKIVRSLRGTGHAGVIVVRKSWALVVVHVALGHSRILGVYFFRNRALYQRARWATELDYERTVYDCRQPE